MKSGPPSSVVDFSSRVRELLQPERVEGEHLPKWILKVVRQLIESNNLPPSATIIESAGDALRHALSNCGGSWADHLGLVTIDGHEFLVAEPYAAKIRLEMLHELQAFVDLVHGDYVFSSNSWQHPGGTLRIVVAETPDLILWYNKRAYFHAMEIRNKFDQGCKSVS